MAKTKRSSDFRRIDKWLHEYEFLKLTIEILEREIEDIKKVEIDGGCNGISYDNIKVSPTNSINNMLENNVIRKHEILSRKELEMKALLDHKAKMDRAYNNFNSDQKIFYDLFYVKKYSRIKIMDMMNINKNIYNSLRSSTVYSALNSIEPQRVFSEIIERFVCNQKRNK